jgi:hypothetical protein
MSIPSGSAIARAVVLTAISVAILKVAKPYLPAQVQSLLP